MSCPNDPPNITNRPGLPALAYRIGDYASFRKRLIERLICAYPIPDHPSGISLAKLTTRANDDPAIAILDACAIVADVLTFYQERIANEGFLVTATERRSVLELARMLGYELNPGVAASTVLAFSVDTAPGSPAVVTVPQGTQIMSVPIKDELPQTFETSQEFIARVEWNALKPRPSRPQEITSDTQQIYLDGINTQLQAGDSVLLVGGEDQNLEFYLLTLAAVEPKANLNYTQITWKQLLPATIKKPLRNPRIFAFRQRANLFGNNAPQWKDQSNEIKQANGGTVRGGILRSDNNAAPPAKIGDRWTLCDTGLPNVDILSLAASDGTAFAGTAGRGIFRTKNKGTSWEAVNTGLTNLSVQVLYVDRETKYLYAGTPGGGLFRSKDNGGNWVPIHLGGVQIKNRGNNQFETVSTALPNTVVRSVLTHRMTFTNVAGIGKISSFGTTVQGDNTEFLSQLQKGDTITVLDQSRRVNRVDSDTSLEIDRAFENQSLNPGTSFSLTTSISPGAGLPAIDFPLSSPGTISSIRTVVRGDGINFDNLRTISTPITITANNPTVTAASQKQKIIGIVDDNTLTIENAFVRSVLDPGTTFLISNADSKNYLFVGTDDGVYYSEDEGKNWKPSTLLNRAVYALILSKDKKYLLAGTDQGVYYISDVDGTWQLVSTNGLSDRRIHTLIVSKDGNLLAGTPTGIFRLINPSDNTLQSGTWTQVASGLIKQVQALTVDSTGRSFAGTVTGTYSTTDETTWQQSNGEDSTELGTKILSALNVTSLAVLTVNSEESIFAGSRFSGFVEDEWPNFPIAAQSIDLDTLYPKVLKDSWFVLADGHYFEAHAVHELSTVPITDFTVTAKVTRIEPASAIAQPTRFNRRSTAALVQSELLPLAEEILTIPVQKNRIFLDPILGNKIFLSQYVPGLLFGKQVIISGKRIRAEMKQIGGVFHLESDANGESWLRTNQGLTNTAVTGFVTSLTPVKGTIIQNPAAVVGTNTAFTRELKVGSIIVTPALRSIQTVLQILSDTSLILNSPFSSPAESQGVVFIYESPGTGTISSDRTTVTGIGTRFTKELQKECHLVVGVEEKKITQIESDTSLTIESAFSNNLPVGTAFKYRGDGTGTIDSDRTAIQGQNTAFTQTLKVGHAITINRETRIVTRIDSDTSLFVNSALSTKLPAATAFERNDLFVGTTGGGIFRSKDNGLTWEAINSGLTNLEVQALAINRQVAITQGQLVAATSKGLFRYIETELSFNGKWERVNVSAVHEDIQAIAIHPDTNFIVIGTISGGVFYSSDNGTTWTQSGLNNVDVQALAFGPDQEKGKQIFAGTVADGVFYSSDSGASWNPINTGLTNLNITALVVAQKTNSSVLLAGTAGSGIFRMPLNEDVSNLRWESSGTNPIDLMIRCLTVDSRNGHLLAGTATGGVFRSVDDGNLWGAMNTGLTSTNPQLNPDANVNTDIRAIASLNDQLFAAGIGILISPSTLLPMPMQVGDRLQVLAPPQPIEANIQQWQLQDRNGFIGVLFTTSADDIELQPASADDAFVSEPGIILDPPVEQQQPILTLMDSIQNSYDPTTVSIYANVVNATHGETSVEALGSGDGTAINQQFALKKPPLTYVSAPTASGSESTLQVRVNDVLWQQVPSLYQRSAQEQSYIVRIEDDSTTRIVFGDGKSGARLPTGQENIVATYRSGIGLAGQVSAGALSLLKTRPLGISEVINPLPATGAAEPEAMAEARTSAPLTVRTLGRIVSLQDYEDFARAFAGIGKAQAVQVWTGESQQVHITVGAIGGAAVDPDSALYDNLVKAIDNARDPVQQAQVASYERLRFNLEAKLLIDPRYLADQVLAKVQAALMAKFAFEVRDFGQFVTASEVIATIQAIAGIIAVDLDALYRRDAVRSREQALIALPARWDPDKRQILPAQMLLLNPVGIGLSVEAAL